MEPGGLHLCLPSLPPDPLYPSTSGEPFDPKFVLGRSVCNIICSVIFGNRFDYNDERLLTIIHLLNDNFQILSSPWGKVRRPSYLGDRVGAPHSSTTKVKQRVGWDCNWPYLTPPLSCTAPPSHTHVHSTAFPQTQSLPPLGLSRPNCPSGPHACPPDPP